jgi:hypothetical protein
VKLENSRKQPELQSANNSAITFGKGVPQDVKVAGAISQLQRIFIVSSLLKLQFLWQCCILFSTGNIDCKFYL